MVSEICLPTVKCNSKEGDFRSKIFFKLFMTRLKIENYYILEILFILQTISKLYDSVSDKKVRQPLRKNTTYFVVFLENRTLYYYINLSTDLFTYTLLVFHRILSTNLDIWLKKLSYTVYFIYYLKMYSSVTYQHKI